ncbi:hypothetical protein LTR17_018550 [Elasticomyces elasticus]|nr:hypothetical protein LTR17_018550 [Elasticomyces elasticus]
MASARGSEVDSPSASVYEPVKEIPSTETAAEVKRQLGLGSSKNDLYVWSMLVDGAKEVHDSWMKRTDEISIRESRSIVPQEELKKAWTKIPPKLRNVMVEEVVEQHWSKLDCKSSRAYDAIEWAVGKAHERRKNKDRRERKKATTPAEAETSARDDATPELDPGMVAEAGRTTPAANPDVRHYDPVRDTYSS